MTLTDFSQSARGSREVDAILKYQGVVHAPLTGVVVRDDVYVIANLRCAEMRWPCLHVMKHFPYSVQIDQSIS